MNNMQLARVEVPDDRTLLLHLGLPFFTVGGLNSSFSKNIITPKETFKAPNIIVNPNTDL